jgi:hypothetical protein
MLSIDFDNGEHGILDMKPFLDFGVFRKLKDRNFFKRVHVAFDTIEWDLGLDLDPEFVYAKCQSQKNAQSGSQECLTPSPHTTTTACGSAPGGTPKRSTRRHQQRSLDETK